MKEMRVYVIDISMVDDKPTTYTDEQFMDIAEKQGGVYTLKNFEYAFNYEELDIHFDYIRFIEVEI